MKHFNNFINKTSFLFSFIFTVLISLNAFSQNTELCLQTGHICSINHLAISPNSQFLASSDVSNKINLWHLPTSGQMSSFFVPLNNPQRITHLDFSSDNKFLIIQSNSKSIYIWDISASSLLKVDVSTGGYIYNICKTKDPNSFLVLTTYNILFLLNLKEIKITSIQSVEKYFCIKFNEENKTIYGLTKNHLSKIDLEGDVIKESVEPLINKVTRLLKTQYISMSYDTNGISSSDFMLTGDYLIVRKGIKTIIYNLSTGVKEFAINSTYVDERFFGFDYSRVNNLILIANSDGRIYSSELDRKKNSKRLKGHFSDVYDVVFSPDQSIFASCSRDRSILIWDSKTLKPIKRLFSRAFAITSLNCSSDEKYLVFGNEIGFTRTLNIESTLMEMQSVRNHSLPVADVSFLPGDLGIITCSNDNHICLLKTNPLIIDRRRTYKHLYNPSILLNTFLQKLGFYIEPFITLDKITLNQDKNIVTINAYRTTKKIVKKSNEYNKKFYTQSFNIKSLKSAKYKDDKIPEKNVVHFSSFSNLDLMNPKYGHKNRITGLVELKRYNLVITSSLDATLKFWNRSTGNYIATLIPIDRNQKILITADNYYIAPKEALDAIGFKSGLDYFPPDQFDLQYNRPDIVQERLGIAPENLIRAYKSAYLKRLKRMNFNEEMLGNDMHIPDITILNKSAIPLNTNSASLNFTIQAHDTKYPLDRINVYLNNVPVYGIKGIELRDFLTLSIEKNVEIELAKGQNKIQVSVLNSKGVESLKESFEINYIAEAKKPNLYIVTIGTSEYDDKRFNLNYAAKDAQDMASLFQSNKKLFDKVYIKTLTNSEVTRDNILKLKDFLNQADRNDIVIVFVAGHGLLDESFNYYYGTSNVDFNHPEKNGISYEELESILDGLKALKKLLFMDTCHSGELDKDEVEINKDQPVETGNIAFRAAGIGVREKEGFGFNNTNELTRVLFSDLRRGTGSTVISSSGGAEYSLESKNWKNGLFTFCLLEGLSSRKADINRDGKIMVSELQEYIRKKVTELSEGKQVPTSRVENISMDFRIW